MGTFHLYYILGSIRLCSEIDETHKNNFGTPITITSYNSEENSFTCPSDGYAIAYKASIKIGGANGSFPLYLANFMGQEYNTTIPTFVKKGMKLYTSNVYAGGNNYFIPFV